MPRKNAFRYLEDENFDQLSSKEKRKMRRQSRRQKSNVTDINQYRTSQIKTSVTPKNDKQKLLMNTIRAKDMTIVYGSAGGGKTYVTAAMAALMLMEGKIDKIYITRPVQPTGKSIGYFPGTLQEKMSPWVAPILSVFKEYMKPGDLDYNLRHEYIEIIPFEVIRGRSLNNAFVILDEAQNTSIEEMKAFVTRMGENSKVVMTGDPVQNDIGSANGLEWAKRKISTNEYLLNNVGLVTFTSEDVVRSGLCKAWVEVIEKEVNR